MLRLALFILWTAAAPAQAAPAPWQKKPFGALVLLPQSAPQWKEVLASLRKAVAGRYPVEEAQAPDVQSMQKAVERLEAQRVKKIVVIPLFASSHVPAMDQIRYLFGIRKEPSSEFLEVPHSHPGAAPIKRVKSKTPVVLARALDDHAVVVDILASRARALGKNPSNQSLLLVASAAPGDAANTQWPGTLNALAEKARRKDGFAAAKVFILTETATQEERDKEHRRLRDLAKAMKKENDVLVIPLTLTRGGFETKFPKLFDGIFIKISAAALLPDSRINDWVDESARGGSLLPDMRMFDDPGRPLPKSAPRLGAPKAGLGEKP